MITNENKKLAQWAMEYALKNGCQSSRVTLYNGSSSSFEIRDMKIDRLQQASENSMVVHLFVDGRYGSYSTNRLDKKELEKFIKDGISATRFLAEDKARTLPDASLYYKGGAADLRLVDPNFDSVQPDDKVALAMSVCEEIHLNISSIQGLRGKEAGVIKTILPIERHHAIERHRHGKIGRAHV